MLTKTEIQSLRESVKAAESRDEPDGWYWVYLEGGPLDGLKMKMRDTNARGVVAWCQPTNREVIQVEYEPTERVTFWKFKTMRPTGSK